MDVAPDGTGPVVLVVDDEAIVLRLMERALLEAGYRVVAETDAVRVLELAVALPVPPGILVTDIRMASLDGVALAGLVRNRWPGLRLLFVTGYDTAHHVLPGPVLQKPFGPAQLTSVVARLLTEPGALDGVGS